MNFFQFLRQLRTNVSPPPVRTTFECPNCWGTQQWENEHKAVNIDLRKDLTRIGRSRKGFIQRFVDRHLPRRA